MRSREIPPSANLNMMPNLASQSCMAFSSMARNTGSRSPGELLITLSTSEVAVCCSAIGDHRCADELVEQPRVLDGDDGLRGEVRDQLDLLVGERPHFLPVNSDGADQFIVLKHRHSEDGFAAPARFPRATSRAVAFDIARLEPSHRRC